MPAKSQAQRKLFAIALHHPSELNPTNRGLTNLPKQTLHEFASSKETGLPKRVKPSTNPRAKMKLASLMDRKPPVMGKRPMMG